MIRLQSDRDCRPLSRGLVDVRRTRRRTMRRTHPRSSRWRRRSSTRSITIRPSGPHSSRSTRRPPTSASRSPPTLPRLDSLWQSNRATANNVFGQLLPQSVIPAISGPVLSSASSDSVWGSAAGALFSWEPFDFGLRGATVAGAEAAVARARADEALTRLDVQSAVGAAFLDVVRREQPVAATQADVERRDVLARAARTLADNQLRPGAEASRADAERAAAQTRAIQARQALAGADDAGARARRDEWAGRRQRDEPAGRPRRPTGAPSGAASDASPRPGSPGRRRRRAGPGGRAARTRTARASTCSRASSRAAAARMPMVTSTVAAMASVSSARTGRRACRWSFRTCSTSRACARGEASAAASTRAETARYDEALLTVTSEQQAAAAMVDAARAVAANTPVQLAAAQQSEAQARAPAIRRGSPASSKWPTRRACSRRRNIRTRSAKVDVWRALLAQPSHTAT